MSAPSAAHAAHDAPIAAAPPGGAPADAAHAPPPSAAQPAASSVVPPAQAAHTAPTAPAVDPAVAKQHEKEHKRCVGVVALSRASR